MSSKREAEGREAKTDALGRELSAHWYNYEQQEKDRHGTEELYEHPMHCDSY